MPSMLLSKDADGSLVDLMDVDPKDALVAAGGDTALHVKPEGQLWSRTTACGLTITKELSVEQTRDADLDLICPSCCSFRSIDNWLAATIELE